MQKVDTMMAVETIPKKKIADREKLLQMTAGAEH